MIDGADSTLDAMERVPVNPKNRPLNEIKLTHVRPLLAIDTSCAPSLAMAQRSLCNSPKPNRFLPIRTGFADSYD